MTPLKILQYSTALVILSTPGALAGTVSPVQSGATPFGLEPIADVQLAGSDKAAEDFSDNTLPALQEIVNNTLTERQAIDDVSSIALDPNDLVLNGDSEVRVYFVGEGAGYRNSLGVYTGDSSDQLSGDAALIFPDASTSGGYLNPTETTYRSSRAPVAPGDFVDLGELPDGEQLNLFVVSNGANGGTFTTFTDSALNSDGLEHFVMLATPDNPFLLVGAEDLPGGGDLDYNDLVVAIEVGTATTSAMLARAAPLSPSSVMLLAPLAFWYGARRRKTPDDSHQAVS